MLRIYQADEDIHTATAMKIFDISDPSKLDDYKHRIPAKTTNFLICNLGTSHALSRELIANGAGYGWTVDECQHLIDMWFTIYPTVKAYLDAIGRQAYTQGFITDMFGRREIVPQFFSDNERTREEGVRIACNQRIQSGAQNIIKRAMRNVWTKYGIVWLRKGIVYPVLQVHDDLIVACKDEHVDEVAPLIRYEMEHSAPQMSIPVKVGMKAGKVWGSMKKI
jgi:DNA polymerase-1